MHAHTTPVHNTPILTPCGCPLEFGMTTESLGRDPVLTDILLETAEELWVTEAWEPAFNPFKLIPLFIPAFMSTIPWEPARSQIG